MVQTYTIQSDFVQIFQEKYVDIEGSIGLADIEFFKNKISTFSPKIRVDNRWSCLSRIKVYIQSL